MTRTHSPFIRSGVFPQLYEVLGMYLDAPLSTDYCSIDAWHLSTSHRAIRGYIGLEEKVMIGYKMARMPCLVVLPSGRLNTWKRNIDLRVRQRQGLTAKSLTWSSPTGWEM